MQCSRVSDKRSAAPDERRFKIYRTGSTLALTEVLPILTALGVDVDDEWPYDIDRVGAAPASQPTAGHHAAMQRPTATKRKGNSGSR